MRRKEYIKPSTLVIRIMQRSCILLGSDPREETVEDDLEMMDYNELEEVDW